MKRIGIFFGSDTGNTEKIARLIRDMIGLHITDMYDISNVSKQQIENFNYLIFGIPTWYYGEIQCDWDDFLPTLKKIDFSQKTVALFGCGDQEDYDEYFCDALNIVFNIIKKKKANIVGHWPTKGYQFQESKALLNKDYFVGLTIDEDRQPEKTNDRIKQWIQQIKPFFHL